MLLRRLPTRLGWPILSISAHQGLAAVVRRFLSRFLENCGLNFLDPPTLLGGGDSPTDAVAAGQFSEEFRITGECVLSEVGQREKAGSHRIEMDEVDQPEQRATTLSKDALVTALEQVSPRAVEAVEAVGEGSTRIFRGPRQEPFRKLPPPPFRPTSLCPNCPG